LEDGIYTNIGITAGDIDMFKDLPEDVVLNRDNREQYKDSNLFAYYKNVVEGVIFSIDRVDPVNGVMSIRQGADYQDPQYPSHKGVDYSVGAGTHIYATTGGRVIETQSGLGRLTGSTGTTSAGNYVRIADYMNNHHYYAHLSSPDDKMEENYYVLPGQLIGLSGNSGNTVGDTGNHLHYEVQENGGEWYGSDDTDPKDGFLPKEEEE